MTWLERIVDVVRRTTLWDAAVRLVVLVAPLAVLALAASIAPTGVPGLLAVLIAAGAALTVAMPGSHAAGAELVVLAWAWLATVDDGTTVWTLLAALGVLAFHTASVVAAAAPLGGRPDRAVLAVIGRRLGIVAAVVVLVWAVVALLDSGSRSGNAVVYSAALATIGLLGIGVLVASRTERSSTEG